MDELERIFAGEKRANGTKKKGDKRADEYDVRGSDIDDRYRYTEDGHRIYTPEELKLGDIQDGPDCPFDCNCCF